MFFIVVCPVYTVLVRFHDLYVLLSLMLLDYYFDYNSGVLVLEKGLCLFFLSQPLRRIRCIVTEA